MFYHHLPLYYKFELKMFRANHLNNWRTPRLLNGLKCESKLKTAEEQEVRARSLAYSALRSRGACWRSGMWLEKWQALTTYTGMHKTNTRWLVHNQSTFGVRTNHGQTLCLSTRPTSKWFFLSRDTQMGVSKLPKSGLSQFGSPITLCTYLWLTWGLKQSYSPHQELFNGIWHATCTQGNWVDSWLLVVGSKIVNLTPDLSFGHNLCFRCPNGSCEPILNIYVSIAF
jgi:hypothetical protein